MELGVRGLGSGASVGVRVGSPAGPTGMHLRYVGAAGPTGMHLYATWVLRGQQGCISSLRGCCGANRDASQGSVASWVQRGSGIGCGYTGTFEALCQQNQNVSL
jgi:hypothetical protein